MRANRPHFCDDSFSNLLGLGQWQQIGKIAARNTRERQMLAVGRRLQALDDVGDLIEIAKIELHVRADRKSDTMRIERDAADKIEDFILLCPTTVDAVIHGNFEDVEGTKIGTCPICQDGTVSQPNTRLSMATHRIPSI